MNRFCLSVAIASAMSLSIAAHANDFGLAIGPSTPRTVMTTPVEHATLGSRDGRYWDGHRQERRAEWEEHQVPANSSQNSGHDRYRFDSDAHCPPGRAKKHAC
ncbi:hypothetical protein [Paraburkholderia rhynchosiae]|uniref:Uncharacterized protein n=1 Tax=Paraburkholderia rhynchosiae TaxID=487049 RepID=A0A2N7WJ56_9BURK|nr:hypothetical protein [Paraburkholderia rhynchosiae]PMS29452.1 hypothetical protein C0Z16_17870 [Paraburkholderia rhynchosiae]CAB3705006.1 hypothetical protein LMG27174_03886 [Paraburkholderia rhynchosiae]